MRIHLSGVMYNDKQNSWSSKGTRRANFLPKTQMVWGCGGGRERNDTRRESGLDEGFFEWYLRENCRLCRILSFSARR